MKLFFIFNKDMRHPFWLRFKHDQPEKEITTLPA